MKKRKLYIRLGISCSILVVLVVILIKVFSPFLPSFHFVTYDTMLISGNNHSVMTVIEPLYVDGKEVCSFATPSSDSYKVWHGIKFYSLEEALKKKIVTLKQLQKAGLPCR